MDQAGAPIKIKFRDHRQVYFHTAYQGSGSLNGTLGSFSYSLTPSGPEVGTVGTGFDDAEREWIWKSRNTLKGRKVVIKSDEQFPSGAYRAPSYDHFHD
jgi:ATP-dependent DNA ligase